MTAPRSENGPDRPTLAVSMGDPLGIGPEVVVKALADREVRRRARWIIYGTSGPLLAAAEGAGVEPFWWRVRRGAGLTAAALGHDVVLVDDEEGAEGLRLRMGEHARPTEAGGAASFRYVEDAIVAAQGKGRDGETADGIVTAPISKAAWALAGRGKWAGHTELLASRLGAKRSRMMFVAPQLRVMLVTAHVPLMDLRNVITIGLVSDTIDLAHEACVDLGLEHPRIAVAGLNPHAGEGGLLGDEETRLIEPAVRHAQQRGIDAQGPLPGDTVFNAAVKGRFDMVVAMYHDQGLIPVKLLAFDSAVNVTAGLPTVRTSPDHGTAFDIAGRNRADAGSMRAALELAATLAAARRARSG